MQEPEEDDGEDIHEIVRRRRNRRRKLPLSVYISVTCLVLSGLAIWLVFSKIAELNQVKKEINESPSGKRIR